MNIFNFLKNAGEKVFNNDKVDAQDLKKAIDRYNFGATNVQVDVQGNKAILKGHVKDRDTYERLILAAGNVHGIDTVDVNQIVIDTPAYTTNYNTAGNPNLTQASHTTAANQTFNNQTAHSQGSSVPPAYSPRFYEVKAGDNLSKIAEEVYGKGNSNKYTLIFEANKPMLTSPDKIYPGQMLRIPPLH